MDKRTVRRIVATALAVILAEQVFFLICGFGLPVQFGDTFMGELKSKYERLKETSGKPNTKRRTIHTFLVVKGS